MRRSALWGAVLLGCGLGCGVDPDMMVMDTTSSFDCATLSTTQTWWIGPSWEIPPDPFQLAVGGSRHLWLEPILASLQCPGTVTSITWSVQDSGVAKIDPVPPDYDDTWVTGINPGTTAVSAGLTFADGRTKHVSRTVVVSVSSPPPGSVIVLEGTVELEGCGLTGGCDFRRNVPFSLSDNARQLDATLDWTSLWNEGDLILFRGTCAGDRSSPCHGLELIPISDVWRVKPLPLSASNLPAGPYTLRIDNLGSGRDTFHYEVRVTPP